MRSGLLVVLGKKSGLDSDHWRALSKGAMCSDGWTFKVTPNGFGARP